MARWKLATAHYLNCPGTEWEYNEQSRSTGKPQRRRFQVPRLLDPREPGDWTNSWGPKDNSDGEVIVCYEGKGEPRDIVFEGDPTPDMIPVDDEARELSASFEDRWRYKPETAEVPFAQTLVDELQETMKEARPVEIPGLADLASAVAQMAQTNQEMLKAWTPRRI